MCFSRRDRFADEPTPCGDRGGPRAAQMRQAGQAALRACAGTVFGHPQTQHPAVQQLRVALRLRIPLPENLNRRVHRHRQLLIHAAQPQARYRHALRRVLPARAAFIAGHLEPNERTDNQKKRTFLQSSVFTFNSKR